ncbi:Homocysteine S-methyltransferase 1 [Bienertia sinuspersici]
MQEAESLLEKNVRLAIDARDEFWNAVNKNAESGYNKALVAGSIGSYGAFLADGSEYSGLYGQSIGVAELKDFHRRRLQVLAGASPDLLAFETIPSRLETQAIVELLEEEDIHIPSWISFSTVDGEHAP